MFYATTTKNCLPKKNVCVSAEENGERRTETDASGGEFPNREFPRSGIDGNSSGIPFSKIAFSGNSEEFPEGAILEKGIPDEFPSIPDLGNSRFGNSPH